MRVTDNAVTFTPEHIKPPTENKRGILNFVFLSFYIGRKRKSDDERTQKPDQANNAKPNEGASVKKDLKKKKKHYNVRDPNAFSIYLLRILKTTKPDIGISKKAMGQLSQMIGDLLEQVMDEARDLTLYSKKQTLGSKEIESSVKLIFSGELQKMAVSQGRQAIAKYAENQ
jgi:histone H2B